jgi:hypothetical protein
MVLAVLVASAAVAGIPRVIEHASELDLRATVRDAPPERRNIELGLAGRIPAGSEPLSVVDERSDVILDNSLPDSIRPILTDELFVIDTPAFEVTSYPERVSGPFPTTIRFRFQEDIDTESTLVEGALPKPREPVVELEGPDCPSGPDAIDDFEPADDLACERRELPVIQTLLSRRTALDMGVEVGERLTLTPDLVDIDWQLAGAGELRLILEIAGIVELSDLSGEYWFADNTLHLPRITENADYRLIEATGLLVPDQYGPLLDAAPRVDLDYSWRLFVDPDRIHDGNADELVVDLANVDVPAFEVSTGIPELVGEHRTQRTIVVVLLSTVAVGLAAIAGAVSVALALLWSQRDASGRSLVIARGASRRQLVTDAVRTAAAIVAPASALGSLLAWGVFRSTDSRTAVLASVALALTAAAAIIGSVLASSSGPDRSPRRTVVEIAVVACTAGAVTAARRRGAIGDDGIADVDALLAAVPTAVVVSTAIVLVRLVGPAARTLAALAEHRRGLAWFIGLRHLVARSFAGRATTGVLLVCVGIAVFAASLDASISVGREALSWYEAGSDVTIEARLTGSPLPSDVAAADLDAPTARRTTYTGATARLGRDSSRPDVIAIDAAAYRRVLEGAPIRQPPLEILDGSRSSRPTAIVSQAWPRGAEPAVGDELTIDVGSGPHDVAVGARVVTFPAIDPGRPFVIVDTSTLGDQLRPTALHIRGDPGDGIDLDDELIRMLERQDVLDDFADDPLSAWTVRILRVAGVLAATFGAIATLAGLALSVAARTTETAVLRTLGVATRGIGRMTVVEQVPMLLAATVGGALGGAGALWLLRPALGLARFAGPERPIEVGLDLPVALMTTALLTTTMAIAIGVSMWAQRRTDLAGTLRAGETT